MSKRWWPGLRRSSFLRHSSGVISGGLKLNASLRLPAFWRLASAVCLLKWIAVLLAWAAYTGRIPTVRAEMPADQLKAQIKAEPRTADEAPSSAKAISNVATQAARPPAANSLQATKPSSGKPHAKAEAEEKRNDDKVETKTAIGKVVAVTKRAMSVECAVTPNQTVELLLPFADQIQVQSFKSLSELKPGDTVRVQFEQTSREGATEKDERVVLKTLVKQIALLERASGHPPTPNTAVTK